MFTVGTIIVALFGSMTVLPINIIIVQLFRKSKSKKAVQLLRANKKAEQLQREALGSPIPGLGKIYFWIVMVYNFI